MKRILSSILILSLLLGCMTGLAKADGAPGKYVSDVFIAYGKTEDEARTWLTNNGWEPIQGNGDFCAGKNSAFDSAIAAVMGIKRTNDPAQAVTDMAVMNMTGGYSFPDYETLLNKKKAEIDEFINSYMPVIREYRDNYRKKDGSPGKKRADLACEVLNRFYDGGPSEPYAKNDTGRNLGELLLENTRQEGNGSGLDLQQVFLEASGAAVIVIEHMLALAADTAEDTWLERLSGLTGKDLAKNIGKYVPEAAGQNLAGSAINIFLRERFGDAARIIAAQWPDIHEELVWYETYCDRHDLWDEAGETAEDYKIRRDAYFDSLRNTNEVQYNQDHDRFLRNAVVYTGLYEMPYKGGWGDTLGDFFNPYDGTDYSLDADNFLTFAAAMSPGQRAALEMVSLRTLLLIGSADSAGLDFAKPDLDGFFGDAMQLSVYTGINRGIFRAGVALTSEADMDQHSGYGSAYADLYDNVGIWAITAYAAAVVGIPLFISGCVMYVKGVEYIFTGSQEKIEELTLAYNEAASEYGMAVETGESATAQEYAKSEMQIAENALNAEKGKGYYQTNSLRTAGRVLMCIGAAIMIYAAFAKGYQLYKYYQKTFTPIPLMIVDAADIVTYTTDADGNIRENINFDQYVYYQAVKCNRQEVGEISDWQSGVSDYQSWGCGDAADLNGDFGQEWLALYTVKSPKKGDPILADSLLLQYGSSVMPKTHNGKLHLFTYTHAVDLGDMAYSFNNDKNGVYFFWRSDPKAYNSTATASAFTRGQLAMTGAAGLFIGILGATLVLYPKKKREQEI